MRILTISGQNIASLAQPFAIDFTTAPLAGAGLFAITGETGAGKSSILDAMCLALYGDAPRLSGGAAADEVPDPSGEAIKAKDSRAILRRGATQGWAEVRFTARDGQDYIARWQARRARDKADGRLQNVSRSVARASDGQVLANQTTAVTEQIEALTGFSYDEFRRTVLLAQGDFDAFLRADTNERAGLLEKVTGTGLYRAVSVRIFERTETARQVHAALTEQRAGYQILSAEDRSAMEAEVLALSAAGQEDILRSKSIKEAIDQHTRLAETARLLGLAEDVKRQALAAQTEAADERDWLSRIDRAAPLRAPWQTVQGADERLNSALIQVDKTRLAASETAAKAAEDQRIATLAETELATKEAEFKAFGPIWDQAAALDSQITSAKSELEGVRARAITLEQDAKAECATLTSLTQEEGTARTTLAEAAEKLERLSADSALADDWPQIAQRIADHADAQQTLDRAEVAATEHGVDVARLNQSLAELIALTDNDRAAEVTLTERRKELDDQISAREMAHPSGRGGELVALSSALASMAQAAVDQATATTERAAAEAAGKRAAQSVAEAMAEGAAATVALTVADTQVTALSAPTEQAMLAASDAAREMRLRLEPGAPCPVCGSCDHPAHADAAIAALAARLRADLDAARQTAQEARNRQAEAHRVCDRAQTQIDQAFLNVAAAKSRIMETQDQWQKARQKALTIGDCPGLPAEPDADPLLLSAIITDIAEAQRNEETVQAELTTLRRELTNIAARRDTLLSTISSHAQTRVGLNVERAEAEKLLALAAQDAERAQGLILRHVIALRPKLEKLGETIDALKAPDLTTRLSTRVSVVIDLRSAHEAASVSLMELGPKLAAAQSRVDSAQLQANQAQEGTKARQSALATLQTKRAQLLNGEATAFHRTRHNTARRAALAAHDTARSTQAASANIAAAAQARTDAAEEEKADAEMAATTARKTLDAAFAGSELALENLDALFAFSMSDVAAVRQKLRGLDDAVTSASATVESRKIDSEAAQAGGVPEQSIEDLTVTLTALDAAATIREQRVGAISEGFRRDATTRASITGLDAEIALAGKESDVWQAVNNAVGSRNGDRFARIAQSITLDVLVDHANQYLTDLNPRYRLRRATDLALQVEDRDMANEARATRSLSGGERFLVSLALALALSRMGGKGGLVATLFIDEGFGSLDAGSLDLAIDALESLQSQGRQVGVISHVEAMKDRIPTRIVVRKQGGGKSIVEINGV